MEKQMDPNKKIEQTEEERLLEDNRASKERIEETRREIQEARAAIATLAAAEKEKEPVAPEQPVAESSIPTTPAGAEAKPTAQIPVIEPLAAPATPPPAPVTSPTKPEKNKKDEKETAPKTPAEEINDFIKEFNLNGLSDPSNPQKSLLPLGFNELNEAQKLKVIRDLKRRIVDIVKTDAQTQYSEDLKEKMRKNADPTLWTTKGVLAIGARKLETSIKSSFAKETDLKNLETKVFTNLRDSEEGKKLIAQDLEMLTEMVKDKKVGTWNWNDKNYVAVYYVDTYNIPNLTKEESKIWG